MRCISCDSPDYKILDNVGNRRYYRCNRCGLEWNRKIEPIEDYLAGVPRKEPYLTEIETGETK